LIVGPAAAGLAAALAAGAALAWGLTFALGRAFCQYFQSIREGHVPDPAQLKKMFEEEMGRAGKFYAK
jgi:uncharacterized protein (DUF697 family)